LFAASTSPARDKIAFAISDSALFLEAVSAVISAMAAFLAS